MFNIQYKYEDIKLEKFKGDKFEQFKGIIKLVIEKFGYEIYNEDFDCGCWTVTIKYDDDDV